MLAAAGVGLTLPSSLPLMVAGVGLLTAGFFAVHGVASGWVPARAHAVGVSTGQAASLYLFSYYTGSSVVGWTGGLAFGAGGWTGVVALAGCLLLVALSLSMLLGRRTA